MNMFTPPGQADEQAWLSRISFEAVELQSRRSDRGASAQDGSTGV